MSDASKRVDESWKERAEREKTSGEAVPKPGDVRAASETPERTPPEARFDLFISSLAMEALIALGDMPHPATRKQAANLPQAKYLIDVLGILEEKTKGNLVVEEQQLVSDTVYQLRMRYLAKAPGGAGTT
jgi:hypothetical protein